MIKTVKVASEEEESSLTDESIDSFTNAVPKAQSLTPTSDESESVITELSGQMESLSTIEDRATISEPPRKPSLTDIRSESLQVDDVQNTESADPFASEKVPQSKPKQNVLQNHKEAFDIAQTNKMESVTDLESLKPGSTKVAVGLDSQSESVEVASSQQSESTAKLEALDKKQRKQAKKDSVERTEQSVSVTSQDKIEASDDFKSDTFKGVKLKPKRDDRRERSLSVEHRQKMESVQEKAIEKVPQETIKPMDVKDRRESLSIKQKEQMLESTNDLFVQVPEAKEDAVQETIPNKTESLNVVIQEELDTATDFTTDLQDDVEKIVPANVQQKRRSVSITRQEQLEQYEDLQASSLDNEEKVKSVTSREKRRSISITRNEKLENAKDLEEPSQPEKEKIKPLITKNKRQHVRVSGQEKVEEAPDFSGQEENERQRVRSSKIRESRRSVSVTRNERVEHAENLPLEESNKESIQPSTVNETQDATNVVISLETEALKPLEISKPTASQLKSRSEVRKELPVDVQSNEKVEESEPMEVDQDDKVSIAPKVVEDASETTAAVSIDVKKVDSTQELAVSEPEKVKIKAKSEKKKSLKVSEEEKFDVAIEKVDEPLVASDKALASTVEESEQAVGIVENVEQETTGDLTQDSSLRQTATSVSTDKSATSIEIQSKEKVENVTDLKVETKAKKKIKPKTPKDPKSSIEISEIEKSDEAVPFVDKKVAQKAKSVSFNEEISPIQVTDGDKIETTSYIVEEPEEENVQPTITKESNGKLAAVQMIEEIQSPDVSKIDGKPFATSKAVEKDDKTEKATVKVEETTSITPELKSINEEVPKELTTAEPKKITRRRDSVKVSKQTKAESTKPLSKSAPKKEKIESKIDEESTSSTVELTQEMESLDDIKITESKEQAKASMESKLPTETNTTTPMEKAKATEPSKPTEKPNVEIQAKAAKTVKETQQLEKTSTLQPKPDAPKQPSQTVTFYTLKLFKPITTTVQKPR